MIRNRRKNKFNINKSSRYVKLNLMIYTHLYTAFILYRLVVFYFFVKKDCLLI